MTQKNLNMFDLMRNQMVVIMDPMEDPEDVLRVGRSREKQYVFDIALDGASTQVINPNLNHNPNPNLNPN